MFSDVSPNLHSMEWELHMATPLTLVLCEARAAAMSAELQPCLLLTCNLGNTHVYSREALSGAGQQTKDRGFSVLKSLYTQSKRLRLKTVLSQFKQFKELNCSGNKMTEPHNKRRRELTLTDH